MNKYEILRAINLDQIEYIQKKIKVKLDPKSRLPRCFLFQDNWYWINEIIYAVKTSNDFPTNGFIVRSHGEIYFLYFHFFNFSKSKIVNSGSWVLSYKVIVKNQIFPRKGANMLVNMALKKITDFHGHLCPELVIGAKFCEYITQLLNQKGNKDENIYIVAENSTSAVDAIQVLLGTTIGNQRLKIFDMGKHNYYLYFINCMDSYKFSFRHETIVDDSNFIQIEDKILNNIGTIDDVLEYQERIDNKIIELVNKPPRDLFSMEKIPWKKPEYELSGSYVMCSNCNELVMRSKSIYYQNKFYCGNCIKKIRCDLSYLKAQ